MNYNYGQGLVNPEIQHQQENNASAAADQTNVLINPTRDTKVIMKDPSEPHPERRFDWFILSVLGWICCPSIGICAIYYAVRANHGVDFKISEDLIDNHTTKAKSLTILSIALGLLILFAIIIAIVVIVSH